MLKPTQIRNIRKQLGMTQAEFAKMLGRSRATVFHWERGTYAPRDNILEMIRATGRHPTVTPVESAAVIWYRAARVITANHLSCLNMTNKALADNHLPPLSMEDARLIAAEFPDILKGI